MNTSLEHQFHHEHIRASPAPGLLNKVVLGHFKLLLYEALQDQSKAVLHMTL